MVEDLTGLRLVFFLVSSCLISESQAHPAHAKPVNYPYVVGFERFHSSLDNEEYLAKGGMILLNELNCVACHEPPEHLKDQLQGVEATNLAGVASRLDEIDLEIMIRNPRFLKQDTMMPSLFAGPDRNLEEVEALKQYLMTFREEIPEYPVGDVERGRHFYHRVGCAACHAPEVGYRPPGIPENVEIEMAGLPSVPMNLADRYNLDALTHFLLTPNTHRPSGRMPEFHLSESEATDLAAYLKAGPDLELPENVAVALGDLRGHESEPGAIALGRELFVAKSCNACHSYPGGEKAQSGSRARPLVELTVENRTACLSDRPVGGGVPSYGLDEVQKRAIAAALLRLPERTTLTGAEAIDWQMKSLNCYACHERDGVGGAETAREVYFGFGSESAIALGRWGHLPPDLTDVENRLDTDWLEGLLFGEGWIEKARPYLATRMPHYAVNRVRPLAESLLARVGELSETPSGYKDLKASSLLETADCRNCHGIGPRESLLLPGINLQASAERLQFSYFQAMAEDPQKGQLGVPIASISESETEALWQYLKQKFGREP